jgi:hypothetical protein
MKEKDTVNKMKKKEKKSGGVQEREEWSRKGRNRPKCFKAQLLKPNPNWAPKYSKPTLNMHPPHPNVQSDK